MEVLFISQYFYPEQFSNNNIAMFLAKNRYDVKVLTAVPNYPSGQFFPGYSNRQKRTETWNGIRIWRAWTIARGTGNWRLILNYVTFPVSTALRVLFSKRRPDVVFVSQLSPIFMLFPAILQKRMTGSPIVCWVQDIWPESATYTLGMRNRLLVGLLNKICGWLYRRVDIVLVQSAAFHQMMTRFGIPSERIRLLPNTAPDGYQPYTAAEASKFADRIPASGFRLMFAGNIGESQDFDTLIAAADILRDRDDLHWLIVGSGRDEARVRRLIEEKHLEARFTFLGRHPEEAMPKLFAHADAMLVSLKDIPIFALTVPYKVQCYMACGKPIIGSINGEGARIIDEANAGLTANASKPAELASAIRQMMEMSSDERGRFAANARQYYEENFSTDKVYADLEKALEDARALAGKGCV